MKMWSAKDPVSTFEWRAEDLVRVGPANSLSANEGGQILKKVFEKKN
jgi:hypothetical protein